MTLFNRLLITTALILPAAAQAQTVEEERPREAGHIDLETIVVTGSPITRPLGRTIIAVSALDGEALRENLENSIGETLRREPGVTATFFGAGSSRPIIRGLGGDRIRVLTDGIGSFDAAQTSPDHAVPVEPALAERIEIFRGPASLLYGSSASGGVVNVLTGRIARERPEGGIDAAARYSHSTVNNADEVAAGAKVAVGDIVLHGEGFWRDADDFDIPGFSASRFLLAEEAAEHAEEGEVFDPDEIGTDGFVANSDLRTQGGGGGASWLFDTGRLEGHLGFSGGLITSNYGVPPGAHEHGEEAHGEESEHDHEEEEEEEEIIRIDLEQVRFDVDGEVRGDLGLFQTLKVRIGYGDYRHVELEGEETGTLFENDEVEGRVELVAKPFAAPGGQVRTAYGLQVRYRDFAAVGEEAFVPPSEQTQTGVFALGEYVIGDFLADLALRYERTVNETDQFVAEEGGPVSIVDNEFDSFSVSGGLGYALTDSWFVGVNGFRTERAPSLEETFSFGPHLATGTFEIGDPNLGQEVARGVEATVRGVVGPLTAVVNGFYTDYDGYIFERETGAVLDGLPVFEFDAADAEFRGMEAEIDVDFGGLDLPALGRTEFAGHAQMDYVRATADGGEDEDLPRIPPLSALFGLSMASDLASLRGEVEYVSSQTNVAEFESPTDSYLFVNAYLTLRPFRERRDVAIEIRARNIGDEEGRVHSSFLKEFVPLPGRDVRVALRLAY